jgi:hypothetical protein
MNLLSSKVHEMDAIRRSDLEKAQGPGKDQIS